MAAEASPPKVSALPALPGVHFELGIQLGAAGHAGGVFVSPDIAFVVTQRGAQLLPVRPRMTGLLLADSFFLRPFGKRIFPFADFLILKSTNSTSASFAQSFSMSHTTSSPRYTWTGTSPMCGVHRPPSSTRCTRIAGSFLACPDPSSGPGEHATPAIRPITTSACNSGSRVTESSFLRRCERPSTPRTSVHV